MIQKKTALLFGSLILLLGVLLFFVLKPQPSDTTPQGTTPAPSVVPSLESGVVKKAILSFTDPTLKVDAFSSDSQTVTVQIDAVDHSVTGVQVELAFEPSVITNVTLEPSDPSFFGSVAETIILDRDVNMSTGRVTYIAGIGPRAAAAVGVGQLFNLTFNLNPTSNAASTEITILPSSIVTQEDNLYDSVLKTTLPLKIDIVR